MRSRDRPPGTSAQPSLHKHTVLRDSESARKTAWRRDAGCRPAANRAVPDQEITSAVWVGIRGKHAGQIADRVVENRQLEEYPNHRDTNKNDTYAGGAKNDRVD